MPWNSGLELRDGLSLPHECCDKRRVLLAPSLFIFSSSELQLLLFFVLLGVDKDDNPFPSKQTLPAEWSQATAGGQGVYSSRRGWVMWGRKSHQGQAWLTLSEWLLHKP